MFISITKYKYRSEFNSFSFNRKNTKTKVIACRKEKKEEEEEDQKKRQEYVKKKKKKKRQPRNHTRTITLLQKR